MSITFLKLVAAKSDHLNLYGSIMREKNWMYVTSGKFLKFKCPGILLHSTICRRTYPGP
jgi:hypothetical protein